LNRIIVSLGIVLLIIGILGVSGVIPGLSTVAGSCGTWTTVNPLSNVIGSPSTFPVNQAEQLSARFVLSSGCSISTQFGIGIAAQCLAGSNPCGTSGTSPALTGCTNCIGNVQGASSAASASIDAAGNINFIWGTGPGGSVAIGTGSYPAGAVIQIVFFLATTQSGSSFTNILYVYGQFSNTITGSAFDFSMSAFPTSLTTSGSATVTSVVTVSPLNGYPGPTAMTVACSSTTISPCTVGSSIAGSAGTSTVTLGGNTAGSYTVTVTGTYTSSSGNIVHTLTISLTISSTSGSTTPDFTMTAASSFIAFPVGNTVQIPITLQSLNGFAGTVALSASAAANSIGGSCSSSVGSAILGAGGTAIVNLSLSATSAGTFTCTLTGSSGSLSHTLSLVGLLGGSSSGLPFSPAWIFLFGGAGLAVYGFVRKPT
jgi:hypothetical protein